MDTLVTVIGWTCVATFVGAFIAAVVRIRKIRKRNKR